MSITRLLFIICSLVPSHGFAQEADFDPKNFLSNKYQNDESESINIAGQRFEISSDSIAGVSYAKYSNDSIAFYIEKPEKASESVRVFVDCDSRLENQTVMRDHRLKFETEITDALNFDIGVVGQMIVEECSGKIKGYNLDPNPLEFGVSMRGKGLKRYRLFNRELKPNLGFQMDF